MATPPPPLRLKVWSDVWLATPHALVYLHRKGHDLWTSEVGLPTPLLTIACGLEGTVYLGTEGSGLHSWGGPRPHAPLTEVPEPVVSIARFTLHRRLNLPILVVGCGTSKKPATKALAVTLIGAPVDPRPNRPQGEVQFIHYEPPPSGEVWPVDVAFSPEGEPFITIAQRTSDEEYQSILRRLRLPDSGTSQPIWEDLAKLPVPCTCIEHLPSGPAAGLWVGTTQGLLLLPLSKGRRSAKMAPPPGCPDTGPINTLLRDTRGWLWVAAQKALYLYADNSWRRFKDPPGAPLGGLTHLVENGMGDIYAAYGDRHLWLKWSKHPGEGGVSPDTLHSLTTPLGS